MWLPPARTSLGSWPATQACALAGNWTSNPLVCRPVLNPLSHTSQGIHFFSCKRNLLCICLLNLKSWTNLPYCLLNIVYQHLTIYCSVFLWLTEDGMHICLHSLMRHSNNDPSSSFHLVSILIFHTSFQRQESYSV